MLKINNISKKYDGKYVLRDFSVELPDIGLYTVTGESGVGKTTLLNIIAGLIKADGGEIKSTHTSLSYAFQDYCLFPWLTVYENIELVLGKENRENIYEWIERVELSDSADKYPDELSGGMKQRVSLARALAYPSTLVLLDEAFKGLDRDLHDRMYALIKKEAETRLIVMVTHDEEDVSENNIHIK